MKRLGILTDRLRALVRRDAVIEEIDEEMRFHVEMETQTNIERGMRPEEARAVALRSFGNPGRMKDLAYEIRGGRILDRFWEDIRYSLRRLLENPTFTCAAALVIALGIGPNTAMFSAIYGVFFAGWAESSRLVVLWANPRDNSIEWRGAADGMDRTHIHISPREFEEWSRRCPGFESFGAVVQRRVTLNDDAQEPEQIVIKLVTPGLFAMDRERVILGRDFAPEDVIPGNQYVVILSSRENLVKAVVAKGQAIKLLPKDQTQTRRQLGWWVAIQIDTKTGKRIGVAPPGLNGSVAAY